MVKSIRTSQKIATNARMNSLPRSTPKIHNSHEINRQKLNLLILQKLSIKHLFILTFSHSFKQSFKQSFSQSIKQAFIHSFSHSFKH